jgi:hypothetical protein
VGILSRSGCDALNKQHVMCGKKEYLPGTGVCYVHGGRPFSVSHKALRRATLSNVAKINEVVEGQLVFVDNPFDTLNELLMDSRRWIKILETKIDMMGDAEEPWRYQDKSGAEQLRSEIALYERAKDRAIRAAQALAKLNLEERFAKLSEQQAASMMYIVSEVFRRMNLDETQREQARQLVTIVCNEMLTQTGKKRYI